MAREKNPDEIKMSTPRLTLKWPKLTAVDYGTDTYPNPLGSYNSRGLLDRSEPKVGTFLDKIDTMLERSKELAEEAFAKLPVKAQKALEAKHKSTGGLVEDAPYAPVYDEDSKEDTGVVDMKFSMKASGVRKDKTKWSAKPDLFDSRGKPLPKGIDIWGGTVAIVNATFTPYFIAGSGAYGVSRRLNAVQVIDLVAAGGTRAASSYGFGEEEDGYDASSYVAPSEDAVDEDADDASDDGEVDF